MSHDMFDRLLRREITASEYVDGLQHDAAGHPRTASLVARFHGLNLALQHVAAERDCYRQALEAIARLPTVERNPDGDDQAAHTMKLIARDALNSNSPDSRPPSTDTPDADAAQAAGHTVPSNQGQASEVGLGCPECSDRGAGFYGCRECGKKGS